MCKFSKTKQNKPSELFINIFYEVFVRLTKKERRYKLQKLVIRNKRSTMAAGFMDIKLDNYGKKFEHIYIW